MRCADCRYFEQSNEAHGYLGMENFGHCGRWHEGYHLEAPLSPNEAWVENDEGWGSVVGPDFGCVLFEARP